MTSDLTRPVVGFETAETFTNTLSFAYFMRRIIPLEVMLLLLTWLILALLLGNTGLPAVGWLALGLALVFVAAMVYVKKKQFDARPGARRPSNSRRTVPRRRWGRRGRRWHGERYAGWTSRA